MLILCWALRAESPALKDYFTASDAKHIDVRWWIMSKRAAWQSSGIMLLTALLFHADCWPHGIGPRSMNTSVAYSARSRH